MKIIAHPTHNPKIEIIEIFGDLTENTVLELKKYLYTCLDNGKYYMIIDLKHVREVDNKIINILGDFGIQDMQIRLFNVQEEVRWMIRRSGRFDVLRKIYDYTDNDKAVSIFEKEVLEKKRFKKGIINKRRYPRSININVPAKFNYNSSENKIFSGLLNILNISEVGALAGEILVVSKLTHKTFRPLQINGQKLYGLKFRLTENYNVIETTAKCIRDYYVDEKLYGGLIFLDLNEENKEDIRDFVSTYYDLGRL